MIRALVACALVGLACVFTGWLVSVVAPSGPAVVGLTRLGAVVFFGCFVAVVLGAAIDGVLPRR